MSTEIGVTFELLGLQALWALTYYIVLLVVVRFAGKRLAGQTTTFDLIVLITLGVVIQSAALAPGALNALVFGVTVFSAHKLLAVCCSKSASIRHLVRGKPRTLVLDGRILDAALAHEGMTADELMAGLRKLGHESLEEIKVAVLEETGHISAVARDKSQ